MSRLAPASFAGSSAQARCAAATRPASPLRSSSSTRRQAALGDGPAEAGPLLLEPALELRRARDIEAGDQLAPPGGHGLPPPGFGQQAPHLERVAADRTQLQPDVSLPPRDERGLTQGLPERIDRVAKGVSRRFGVRLGPQQGHQAVPGLGSRGLRQGEIEQQGEPLRLGERPDRSAVRPVNLERAEYPEVDHGPRRDCSGEWT